MGRGAVKAAGNPWYEARKAAAKWNDTLSSRAGAAEMFGCGVDAIDRIETGLNKCMPVDMAVQMADKYNAPELLYHYCRNECPIGPRCVPELACEDLDRVSLRILRALNRGDDIKDVLLAITEDGEISESERPQLDQVIDFFDRLTTAAAELKLWAEKYRNDMRKE